MRIQLKGKEWELTQRELQAMAGLEKWGVLGLGQLYGLAVETTGDVRDRVERFFNETHRRDYGRWFTQRLTKLVRRGLIHEHFYVNHRKVFTLAEAGHKKLGLAGLSNLEVLRDSVSEDFLDHELTVAAVGLVLQEIHGLRVRTERERYKPNRRGGRSPAPERAISDLWLSAARPRAIEVEFTQKSESRYKEIWDAYRLRLPAGGAVLYLTAWPDGVPCILKHARRHRAEFVFACGLREFRRACGRSIFTAPGGETFRLIEAGPDTDPVDRHAAPASIGRQQSVASPESRLHSHPLMAPSKILDGTVPSGLMAPSALLEGEKGERVI
ncbi:MAG TPA: hypothetical protein VNK24_09865 [Elusimicrobiota bacterium]|nr:hypothetical protein [Elusimicrobiota bacterium]